MIKKKTTLLSFFVFIFSVVLIAQEAVPFKTQSEFYIYGDAAVIGNNILSKDIKEPFNDNTLSNDDIDMVYVDIDNDESTFSSSSASLSLPNNYTKIKYAALYWSATYSYEKGYKQESNGQFLFQGKRVLSREKINNIKLRLPDGTYNNIKGDVIFDGDNSGTFMFNSPYACVANVTKLLRNANNLNGEITVANIQATNGFVSGGSAAGWLLYIVYEAPTKNPKYITTYDGFAHVSDAPVKLKFRDFKTIEKGETQTKLTFAALEGDASLDEDQCVFVNPITKRVQLLSTNDRSQDNFFNSKITNSNNDLNDRFPNSENTLGFDIIAMGLENASKPLIDNNTTEVDLVFNTEADRFYVFFMAFQTEISKSFYEEKQIKKIDNTAKVEPEATAEAKPKFFNKLLRKRKKSKTGKKKPIIEEQNEKTDISSIKEEKQNVIETNIEPYNPVTVNRDSLPAWIRNKQLEEEIPEEESDIYQPIDTLEDNVVEKTNSLVLNRENYEKVLTKEDYIYETQKFTRMLSQEPIFIDGVEKGYYIISSLVYDLNDAIDHQNELLLKGLNSKIIKDPRQDKYYVYLFNSENFYDVFMLRKAFIKTEFLEQVWILNFNVVKKIIKKL